MPKGAVKYAKMGAAQKKVGGLYGKKGAKKAGRKG